MFLNILLCLFFLNAGLCRNVPRYNELDDDEKQLFRAAYDAPAYDHESYEEEDLPLGKIDLVKDGLWAIKAKIKELKAFDKALAANMLLTKLKVKELIEHTLAAKKHHEKPSYSYQAPSYHQPSYQQYEQYPQTPSHQYPDAHAYPQGQAHYPEHQYPAAPSQQYTHDPYYGH